jgi:hypothetical protein
MGGTGCSDVYNEALVEKADVLTPLDDEAGLWWTTRSKAGFSVHEAMQVILFTNKLARLHKASNHMHGMSYLAN